MARAERRMVASLTVTFVCASQASRDPPAHNGLQGVEKHGLNVPACAPLRGWLKMARAERRMVELSYYISL